MATQVLLSTTGATSPVVINDLGARTFTHPTTNLDLTAEYTIEEIRESLDLQAAVAAGDITLVDDQARSITNVQDDLDPVLAIEVALSSASTLLGRGDSGPGEPEEITIGAGLQMTGTEIENTLSVGLSVGGLGQFVVGGALAGENLLLESTANITKGKIFLDGLSQRNYYDQANNLLRLSRSGSGGGGLLEFDNPAPATGTEVLGTISFLQQGSTTEAQIIGQADGSVGTGRLEFWTGQNERLFINDAGNVVVGTGALADTATNGFLYIPTTTTGAPTGVPTTFTGREPIVIGNDGLLYFHEGGSWHGLDPSVAPTGASYVVVALDGTLTAERRLQPEASVLTLTDGGANGDITVGVAANGITDVKLRDSAALSVIGRFANSAGDPADIAATATSDAVLRESGSTLGFGTVATGGIANAAVTYAKIQNVAATSVLANATGSSATVQEVQANADITVFQRLGGTLQWANLTAVNGDWRWGASLSPASIGANQNNYAPSGIADNTIIRLTASTPVNITGIDATQAAGQFLAIFNIGANTITFTDEDASSTAANRFALGENLAVAGDQGILFFYDNTSSRWRAGGGGAPTGASYLVLGLDGTLTAERVFVDGTGLTATDGGANNNYTVTADLSTGIAGGQTAFGGTAASENLTLQSTTNATRGAVIAADQLQIQTASAGTPGLAFAGDPNTGIWSIAANNVSIAAGGVEQVRIATSQSFFLQPVRTNNGSAGAPSYSNNGDTNTGMYFPGGDQLGFSTGGTGRLTIDSTVVTVIDNLDAQQQFILSGDITPATLTGNVNDWAPTGLSTASVIRASSDANNRAITGLSGGADGRVIYIQNVGANTIVLMDQDVGSTAANRFDISGDTELAADDSMGLIYDSTASRWRNLNNALPDATVRARHIQANAVTDAVLRQGGANTVIGRSANSTGNVADISLTGQATVLINNGTALVGDAIEDVFYFRYLEADQFENVTNSDWSVNGLATIGTDTNNAALKVRLFDDTTEEGVGLGSFFLPAGTTRLRLRFLSRPETTPGGTVGVGLTLHVRRIDGSPGSWEQFDLTDLSFGTSENWLEDNQTILYTDFTTDLVAGQRYQMELTRNTADSGDTLSGDWALQSVTVELLI